MKKALIHYFSGTGNTYHMVNVIGDRIKQQGYEVVYNNIEFGNAEQVNDFMLHVFSYPIYAFGTPSIVLRYFENLKPVEGCKASVICSCYKYEGQSLAHVSSILKRKGYDVFLTDIGIYPHNWTQIANPVDEEIQRKVFEDTDESILELADKITNFQVSIRKYSKLNLVWTWFVLILFNILGRRILGKTFIADNSCVSCEKCKEGCPVKAIQLSKGKPRWNWRCENCQRCINICPSRSIQTSPIRLITFVLVEIAMIFVLVSFNQLYQLPFLVNIFLYGVLFLAMTFFMDMIMNALERVSTVRKIFEYSYTKKYRRYMVKEFLKNYLMKN